MVCLRLRLLCTMLNFFLAHLTDFFELQKQRPLKFITIETKPLINVLLMQDLRNSDLIARL